LNFCVVNRDLIDRWYHNCKYLRSTSYTVRWPCGRAQWSKSINRWNTTAIVAKWDRYLILQNIFLVNWSINL